MAMLISCEAGNGDENMEKSNKLGSIEENEKGIYYDPKSGFALLRPWQTAKEYAFIPFEVNKLVKPAAAVVYGILRFAAHKNLYASMTVSEIAEKADKSERNIARQTAALVDAQLIVILRKDRKHYYYWLPL